MDNNKINEESSSSEPVIADYNVGDKYEIPYHGSIGLLALGHVGLKLWREKREQVEQAQSITKEKSKVNSSDQEE